MEKSKKRSSKLAEIWKSLWKDDNFNEIEDPDENDPDVALFNESVNKQRAYYEKLKVNIEDKEDKEDKNKRNIKSKNKKIRNNENEINQENERY